MFQWNILSEKPIEFTNHSYTSSFLCSLLPRLMANLKTLLPLFDIQSDAPPTEISTLPQTDIREMTWGRHGDNTTLQKTGNFNVTCSLQARSSDFYPPVCRMMYRVHREVVAGEWVGDVWRDVAAGMVTVCGGVCSRACCAPHHAARPARDAPAPQPAAYPQPSL